MICFTAIPPHNSKNVMITQKPDLTYFQSCQKCQSDFMDGRLSYVNKHNNLDGKESSSGGRIGEIMQLSKGSVDMEGAITGKGAAVVTDDPALVVVASSHSIRWTEE